MSNKLVKVEDNFYEEDEISIYEILNIFLKNIKTFIIVTIIGLIATCLFIAKKIIFDKNANKKDSIYWNNFRKIPLTEEEVNNYHKKDSIEKILTSAKYLDSIDKKNNKFSISDIIMGYSYQNSTKKINFS